MAVTLTHCPAVCPQRPRGIVGEVANRSQERRIVFLLLSLSDCKRQRFGGWWFGGRWFTGKVTLGHPGGGSELEREEAKNIGFREVSLSLSPGTCSFPDFCIYSACLFERRAGPAPFVRARKTAGSACLPGSWVCVLPVVTGCVRSSPLFFHLELTFGLWGRWAEVPSVWPGSLGPPG